MSATVRDLIGLATSIVILAGITYAIAYGSNTARILEAASTGFANVIRAATQR